MINSYKINSGANANAKQAYMSFPQNTQIKGTLISKTDKQIRILTQDNETLELTLKKDIEIKKGESIAISKKDISDIKVLTTESLTDEQIKNEQISNKLLDMNIKPSETMIKAYKDLEKFDIPTTAENLEKYLSVSMSLENLRNTLTPDIAAMLTETGYEIDDMPVFEIGQLIKENEDIQISSGTGSKNMTNKQAAEISKQLYGIDMGKDINDIIKALDAKEIPITKEMVDSLSSLYSKLYNIKDADESVIVRALGNDNITIDLLYSIKNNIRLSQINSSSTQNIRNEEQNKNFDKTQEIIANLKDKTFSAVKNPYQIPQQRNISDEQIDKMEMQIRDLIKQLGFDDSMLKIAKALMKADMDIDSSNIKTASEIQDAILLLQANLDKETAAAIIAKNQDILSMDILKLAKMAMEIKNEEAETPVLTKEEMEFAIKISESIKQFSAKQIYVKDMSLRNLLPYAENKNRSVTELFGSSYTNSSDKNEINSIRASYILKSIENIDMIDFDASKRGFNLSSIAKAVGIIPNDFNNTQPEMSDKNQISDQRISNAIHSLYQQLSDQDKFTQNNIYKKDQLISQYNQLRESVRLSHLISMSKSGIDPVTSDISKMNQYIKAYEDKYSKYDFSKISDFDIKRSASDIVKSSSDINLKTASKALDIASSKPNFTDLIDKIREASKARGFSELENLSKQITEQLKMQKENKEDYRQQAMQLHMLLKESEELVKTSKREDRDIFERYLKQMSDSIKMSAKIKEADSMVQIPFYMNDQGSNANVYAKTKNGKKGQIDPEDMSILMDITTKKLGKLGFYIEVDKKNISLKISGGKNTVSDMRRDAQSLNNLLESAGYSLKSLKLSDSNEQTQIEFTEDTAPEFKTSLDVKV